MKFNSMLGGLVIVGAVSIHTFAYEIDPEYRSIASQRGFTLIDPKSVDSEYQSDLLTYQLSPKDFKRIAETRFSDSPVRGHFLISAGSLSATQFDQKLRGEILATLAPTTQFRFLRTEDENYEENSTHSIVELEQRILPFTDSRGLFIAIYGEISQLKKQDDIGLAVLHRSNKSETRIFISQIDFTRSERNDSADRFDSTPLAVGLTHRRVEQDRFLEFFFRRETPIRWNDPAIGQTYYYENRTIGATWYVESEDSNHSIRAQFDAKSTGLESTTAAFQSKRRERIEIEGRREIRTSDAWSFEYGVQYFVRLWQNETEQKLAHENYIPFIWFNHKTGWQAGFETTFFRLHGDPTLGSEATRRSAEESRLNLRYRHRFEANAEVRLALTFDLDGAQGGAFEGGHGQFVLAF